MQNKTPYTWNLKGLCFYNCLFWKKKILKKALLHTLTKGLPFKIWKGEPWRAPYQKHTPPTWLAVQQCLLLCCCWPCTSLTCALLLLMLSKANYDGFNPGNTESQSLSIDHWVPLQCHYSFQQEKPINIVMCYNTTVGIITVPSQWISQMLPMYIVCREEN